MLQEIILKSITVDEFGKIEIVLSDKTTLYFASREKCEEFISRESEEAVLRLAGQWILDEIDKGVDPSTITSKRFTLPAVDVLVEDA